MELREFAERVLFATTLEEKLQTPEVITDEFPGHSIATPAAPGRPRELIFKPSGTARGEFPGTRHLEQNHERGRLLHFFGNHELLATELMALVLLKFPEAPAAFRKGVYETLKDEQEHTRLYRERMKACGVEFGSLPVSGYFWRAVAGMESPMDYVAGLSLTFEQANLDFARHFSACFADVGDADSATLLQKIYRDEIGHVAYGLKWFRRWKNPNESDWEAFCRQLKFPLSPARARGFSINVEGRKAAGLPADFIENLNVFSQSKGRTPTVFLFNPLAEACLAGGKGFSPNKNQAQLARELTALPMFLCRQDDIVLVAQKPAVHFLSGLKAAGFTLPEFVCLDQCGELAQRKLGRLRPWAWGPDSLELLQPLFSNLTEQKRSAAECYNDRIATLYRKTWSANFLRRFLASLGGPQPEPVPTEGCNHPPHPAPVVVNLLCPTAVVGISAHSVAETLAAIAALRSGGHHQVVLKESLGVAGRNALRLFEPELLAPQRRWIERALASGRELVVEPWLDRVRDFSVQLEMTERGLQLCGYTGLINDARGQFQANWAEPKHDKALPTAVLTALQVTPRTGNEIQLCFAQLFQALEAELRLAGFFGPVGIDCLVYREASGVFKLKPVVEINPRYTMGRVTVELMKNVCPGSVGTFRLVNRAALKTSGFADFKNFAAAQAHQLPLVMAGAPHRRIREGFLPLNDPEQAVLCLATFTVSRPGAPLAK